MDYFTLKRWIAEGESEQLDFKTTISAPAKIARNLVAFANCRGGKLVVGVEDKGYLVGVDIEQEKYELEKAATVFCNPAVEWTYRKIEYQGKFAMVVEIPESQNKPHYAVNKKKTAEKLYVRIGDSCVVPPLAIQKMIVSGELNFTYRTAAYYSTKKVLQEHLMLNHEITVKAFGEMQNLSESNSRRMLIDFLFEGWLRLKKSSPMVFEMT